jgi:hypothetical protein
MIFPLYITQDHAVDRTTTNYHLGLPNAARFICDSTPKKFFILMETSHI